jgi:para-aminobenzoate synthetase/4-amino-4-deoxychorismate lyase
MHASRAHGVRHLERHLQRLAASAQYFGFPCDLAALRRLLQGACAALPEGPQRLRLALNQAGRPSVQRAPLIALADGPVKLLLAEAPVASNELFLRHKTTLRARYDASWRHAETQGAFDTLFFNERGELTEGGRSNVFVKLDGRWHTPPLHAGVLPGVMRAVLLDDPLWAAREQPLPLALLRQAQEIVVCNALRGALRATLQG